LPLAVSTAKKLELLLFVGASPWLTAAGRSPPPGRSRWAPCSPDPEIAVAAGLQELATRPDAGLPHCLALSLSTMSPLVAVAAWILDHESSVIPTCLHLVVAEDRVS
jgi:hypothetical protein